MVQDRDIVGEVNVAHEKSVWHWAVAPKRHTHNANYAAFSGYFLCIPISRPSICPFKKLEENDSNSVAVLLDSSILSRWIHYSVA